jgi:hypothetical protein
MLKKTLISIFQLLLINLAVLALISVWAAYYSFGPIFMGGSKDQALREFVRTELVIGGGFVVLFNSYVLCRYVTGKNKQQ